MDLQSPMSYICPVFPGRSAGRNDHPGSGSDGGREVTTVLLFPGEPW